MEAGYDYLLLRGRLQRKLFKYVGIIFFVLGALLLTSGGAYYGYAAKARPSTTRLGPAPTRIAASTSRSATVTST